MLIALILLILLLSAFPFLFSNFRVIFFPTERAHLNYLKKNFRIFDSDLVYDLGCGDGRVLKYLMSDGKARGVGIELSPILYLLSKFRLRKFKNIKILFRDFFKADLGEASLVYCFLNKKVLEKIIPKLRVELKPGTKIISYITETKNLRQESVIKDSAGQDLFFIYEI